jgi:tetratricopeptide (TPR) repeat protein
MMSKPEPISMFISYAHEDEPLRKELEKHLSLLQRQGLVSTWQDRQITAGTKWAQEIDEHLKSASIILLLISADFLASDYCSGVEMNRALERHEADQARVIPILLRPVDWKGAPFAHLQALPTDAKAITTWSNQDEAFVDVVAGLRRVIEDLPFLAASASRALLPAIWNIPYPRNLFFTGRDNLLSQLHTQLQTNQATALSQSPQAISGLGGIGKTQIAIEYAYRYHQEYKAVLWAPAQSQERLTSSYTAIATLLKLPERVAEEQDLIIQAVKTWLQKYQGWLLILDNADELEVLPPFLPSSLGGHLLLTTRAWDMQRLAQRIEVATFSQMQGATFLLQRAERLPSDAVLDQAKADEQAIAIQLTKEVGGLPLALDQAGAYLAATGTSLEEYQRIYYAHRQTLLQERRSLVADHPDAVATTWSLSFQRVQEKNAAATDLLRLCAFLAADGIPEEVFTQGASYLGPLLEHASADPFLFNQAIEALRAYSLLSRDPRTQTLAVHRLVQAVLKDQMDEQSRKLWAERAVLAVKVTLPAVEHGTWPQWERLLAHALACSELIEHQRVHAAEATELLQQTGWYLTERARYQEAELLLKQALSITEQEHGSEHLDTARDSVTLAYLYQAQGKYEQAEPLYLRALSIREQQLGAQHPDTAESLNNLASLYQDQGKYEQAEPLYQRALSIREQQLGPDHPDTATSLNNLAALYRDQGKYEQAEPLYQRALAIYEQQLGAQHPNMTYPLNGLAELYRKQGKYVEAEPLFKRALAIDERALGPQHPTTQTIRANYARLLHTMGHDAEAAALDQP